MRDDFGVLILTHGRADNVVTERTLRQQGYDGKVYFVVDTDDKQAGRYIQNYGADRVVLFDKQEAAKNTDTIDNFGNMNIVVYARNQASRIARELGLKYYLELDDDYRNFSFRFWRNGKARSLVIRNLSEVFEVMLDFLEDTKAKSVAFAQTGDLLGGLKGGNYRLRLLRKVMNTFFCRSDEEIDFLGSLNEDTTAYTLHGMTGDLFFTTCMITVLQGKTQEYGGGLTEAYLAVGTYVKSFYTVIACPSCCKVSMMGNINPRIHHNVTWNNAVPKIVSGKYRVV